MILYDVAFYYIISRRCFVPKQFKYKALINVQVTQWKYGKISRSEVWIKLGGRFEGCLDGNGLYLPYRTRKKVPVWRFRYRYAGKLKVMLIAFYKEMSFSRGRETVRNLSTQVALVFDVGEGKQKRKARTIEKIKQEKNMLRFLELVAKYFERQILGRC